MNSAATAASGITGTRPVGLAIPENVLPLGHLLIRSAERYPDREALVFPDSRQTYDQLATRSWQMARSLVGMGMRPGMRIGVLMTNHPDIVATMFGIWLFGGVVLPINARYRRAELQALIEDAELSAVVPTDCGDRTDFADLLAQSIDGLRETATPEALELASAPTLRAVISVAPSEHDFVVSGDRFFQYADAADDAQLTAWCEGTAFRDLALILYTSGTTSNPRGAMLTHEAFSRIWMGAGAVMGVGEADRVWDPLPLFHVAALGPLVFTVGHGGTFISDYWFDAGRGLADIERERATVLYPAYPPIMQDLLTHPSFPTADLSSVRVYLNCAPPETLEQFEALAPHATQVTSYGGTESGLATVSRLTDSIEERRATCGKPQHGVHFRAVDPETGEVNPPGVPGELQVKGFSLFSGYYNDPVKTGESFSADGWFRSGDYGEIDEEGNVLFLGRLKEMLKVGGENVAPAEIESILYRHPAVKLTQVIGVPDPRLVEVPVAFIELKDGETATAEELLALCREAIASFKVPRDIVFVTEWPMSATKIQRFKLRDQYLAATQAA